MTEPKYIVDQIGEVVRLMRGSTFDTTFDETFTANAPNYMFGHIMEISKRLAKMEQDPVFKYTKFPLVALRQDIVERMTSDNMWEYRLNILLATPGSKTDYSEKRYTDTFKPILYPMFESFMRNLRRVGLFTWKGDMEYPEHTKIDRPYWGTPGPSGNTANILAESIDAIEIIDLKLLQHPHKRCK